MADNKLSAKIENSIVALNHKDPLIAKSINRLQKKAYAIESQITGITDIPNLKEYDSDIEASKESFNGYFIDKNLCGVISFEPEAINTTRVTRLVVSPNFFGKGIATKLLLDLFAKNPSYKFVVSTGKGNIPARKLYEKMGFSFIGEQEKAKGVFLWDFIQT